MFKFFKKKRDDTLIANTALIHTSNGTNTLLNEQLESVRANKMLFEGIIYRIKSDALRLVTEINRGKENICHEIMSKQMLFFQQQLIQACYHDQNISKAQKEALLAFHQINVKTALREKRGKSFRE